MPRSLASDIQTLEQRKQGVGSKSTSGNQGLWVRKQGLPLTPQHAMTPVKKSAPPCSFAVNHGMTC